MVSSEDQQHSAAETAGAAVQALFQVCGACASWRQIGKRVFFAQPWKCLTLLCHPLQLFTTVSIGHHHLSLHKSYDLEQAVRKCLTFCTACHSHLFLHLPAVLECRSPSWQLCSCACSAAAAMRCPGISALVDGGQVMLCDLWLNYPGQPPTASPQSWHPVVHCNPDVSLADF